MLSDILDALRHRLRAPQHLPDADAEAGAAALAWFRSMVTEAEAIGILGDTEFAEATTSNLRSLCEAWLQLRYSLKCAGDANVAGRTARAFALLELHEYIRTRGGTLDDLKPIANELASLRTAFPGFVEDLEHRRALTGPAKLKYWSGKGPAALISAVQPTIDSATKLADFYKMASWDSHHVMTPALNASVLYNADGIHLQFGPRQSPEDAASFSRAVAVYFLTDGWGLIRSHFGWAPLEPPPPAMPAEGEVF